MVADDNASAPEIPEHQPNKTGVSECAGTRHAGASTESRRRVRVIPPEKFNPTSAKGLCEAVDAAAFLVKIAGSMSRGKLQDLLYFAQAWHLVWDNELLYPDPIIATDDGVRIEAIGHLAGDDFTVTARHLCQGQVRRLTDSHQRTLVGVINFYANRNHYRLSELIRDAAPWQQARASSENAAIEPTALFRYYREA